MLTSSRFFLAVGFLLIIPITFFAQEKPGKYYDMDHVLYKHIASEKEGGNITYYDKAEQPIQNTCKTDNREYVHFADIQSSIYRLLFERLKEDTTRQKRSVTFCFAVSDKGVSNVRLINYEWNYTKEELQAFLENLLRDIDLKTNSDCTWVMEIPYWDYTLEPDEKSKKRSIQREPH